MGQEGVEYRAALQMSLRQVMPIVMIHWVVLSIQMAPSEQANEQCEPLYREAPFCKIWASFGSNGLLEDPS